MVNREKRVGKIIGVTCPECGEERKIVCRSASILYKKRCNHCATIKSHRDNPRIGRQENHYNWKGGININRQGYILEYIRKDNPFYPMATNTGQKRFGGYVLQHRLVMAKHLDRCLLPHEIVHHLNGVRADNRIENLNLISRIEHTVTYQDGFREGYAQAMKYNGKIWNGEDWV